MGWLFWNDDEDTRRSLLRIEAGIASVKTSIQGLSTRLARIESTLENARVKAKEYAAMSQQDIDALKAKVQANSNATQSAVTLINSLAQQIRDAADDPDEMKALADQLEANSSALGGAVTANTANPGG